MRSFLLTLVAALLLLPLQVKSQTLQDIFVTRADDLAAGKTATVKELAGLTAATREPQTKAILEAWIAGDIHFRKSDNLIVVVEETDTGLSLLDLFTGEPVAEAEPDDTKKVKNSTPIKAILRPALAALELSNPDPAARKAAAEQLAKKPNEAALNLLSTALDAETDAGARTALENSLIIATLAVGDDQSVMVQLATMGNRLEPTVRGAVQRLVDTPTRAPEVVAAATERLGAINNLVDLNNFGNNLLFGLSQASVLLLSAIGLAITFGVMRVINMAHGEFIMIGAYTTFVVQSQLPGMPGVALLLSIPLAFGLAFTAGVILERTVIRFLYGRPLETLLATFGVSLVLQQSFRLIFTPQNRPVITPDWLAGNVALNPILGLTTPRIFVFVVALAVFFGLLAFLQRSRFGLEMRAVTQNRPIANTMGINSGRVDFLTFGLGSGIAGLAGAVLSQVLKINPDMGVTLIIPSFMVIVIGGVGSLWGALVGAGLVGMATKLVEPIFPNNTLLATAIILVAIIGFIQFRPRGLFAQKGRSAEL
ncbi:MAG TPA: urea ABC transporter permease subunit UrtB [Alphaproteobacteria bacterium]|mgnify:CR=1 FL=1|nr:urea ABC transporter permease subunit UrtB [Alphaproteobacteria bacterium]